MPSTTETVCVLGAGDRLVGCTRYCEEPAAELVGVPRIGGTKNPKLEAIAGLRPDLVLVNGEENRREDIDWLEGRFTVLELTPRTVIEAGHAVRRLGTFLGEEEGTHAILLAIEAQLARAEVELLSAQRLRVVYPIWRKPWMGVGEGTYIHDVLTCAGAENATAQLGGRYPELREEALVELAPDLVLLPSEPWEFDAAQRDELVANGLFGRGVPVELVDGRDFCWHGARTPEGLGRAVDLLARFRAVV